MAPFWVVFSLCLGSTHGHVANDIFLHPDQNAPPPDKIQSPTIEGPDSDVKFPEKVEDGQSRNAKASAAKWPSHTVPYVVDTGMADHPDHRQKIKDAIADYAKYTCIKWVPRTNERNYVRFKYDTGCYSYIGMISAGYGYTGQTISLGKGCNVKGTAIHEMMHTLGFDHEQARADRDTYLKIHTENIQSDRVSQFSKLSRSEQADVGSDYDAKSVMHYGHNYFSANGKHTIEFIAPGMSRDELVRIENELGQRYGFSSTDVIEINNLYGCPASYNEKVQAETKKETSTCQDDPPAGSDADYCGQRQQFCSVYVLLQDKYCRKTCETCKTEVPAVAEASCDDDYPEQCPAYKDYCEHADIKKYCCKTCSQKACADAAGDTFGGTCAATLLNYGDWICEPQYAGSYAILAKFQDHCKATCKLC